MSSAPGPAATPLLYSCVAHNSTILAECIASASSQTSSLASLILPKIEHRTPQKLTYTHGIHHIHYIAEAPVASGASASGDVDTSDNPSAAGLTFLVITEASVGRRIAFGYLVAMRAAFFAEFSPKTTDYADLPNYGAGSFNGTLRTMMTRYGALVGGGGDEENGAGGGSSDALTSVRRDMDDVRGIMGRNIESLLERGERIDLLVDQTDRLGGSAREFRVRSRGLKRQMWWKNAKLMALAAAVVVLVVLTIVLAVKI